ncbi:hypothetical protein B0H14DRAFT_3497995 [Mycena olivaceomarginata]|nr:hypothetical protein B0H14DRAFT_3497995 [Mycena olivaceomarginata]
MVFYKLSVALTSVLIAMAAACCNVVVPSSTPGATAVAHFFGLQISGLGVDVGLGCSPLTVTGNNCGGNVVNCDAPDKEWGGALAINCLPLILA